MGVNGWVRWLETRGLYEPGEQTSTRSDWRGLSALALVWLAGAAVLLGLLMLAR